MVSTLPFSVQPSGRAPVPVRVARFAGARLHAPVSHAPAITEGFEAPVVRAVLEHLIGDARCDAVSLSPLSGGAVAAAAELAADGDTLRSCALDGPGPRPCSSSWVRRPVPPGPQRLGERQGHRRVPARLEGQARIAFRTVERRRGDLAYFDRSSSSTPPTGPRRASSATSATGRTARRQPRPHRPHGGDGARSVLRDRGDGGRAGG